MTPFTARPPEVTSRIRLTVPSLDEADFAAVRSVLETGFLVQGSHVADFESRVAEATGSRHAVAVTNCTAALQMALMAVGVRPGDLVVTTAYSWPSTANVIELCGAQPVFIDIDPDTFNMSPNALDAALDRLMAVSGTARRVRAVLPVHTFGGMADMGRINESAARYGLPVIEDAACALGASRDGMRAGSAAALGCFSFHPRKAVTTGEGGVITTDDEAYADYLRALRNHGQHRDGDGPTRFVLPGFNNRMTEFQGALGGTQMTKLDRIVEARRSGAARYDALLADTSVQAPSVPGGSRHVYQSYVVRLPERLDRQPVLDALHAADIEATVGTYHMPLIDYFKATYGFQKGDFPIADSVAKRTVTMPLHEGLTLEEQERVVETLLEASR